MRVLLFFQIQGAIIMKKATIPTVDELIKKHKVVEKARIDAQQGLPSKDQEPLSATEKVLTDLFVKDTATVQHERDQQELEVLHHDRVNLGILKAVKNLETAPEDLQSSLDKLEVQQRPKLIKLKRELIDSEYSFKLFKSKNTLTQAPIYPESNVFHYSVIALIVLIETILNTVFFAAGSELGLIGGFASALIITCLNVLGAGLLGTLIIPLFFHIKIQLKISAVVLTAFYLWLSVVFSLLVGHYRSVI